jgi:ankyrin repeat protein
VKALVKAGAEVNARDEAGDCPIHAFVHGLGLVDPERIEQLEGRRASLRVLLDAGADVNAQGADGRTSLGLALVHFRRHGNVVPWLLTDLLGAGASASAAFTEAVDSGLVDIVAKALSEGADPNAVDSEGRSPLWWALERGPERGTHSSPDSFSVVESLLRAGADPRRVPEGSTPPLHQAISKDWPRALEALLQFGADAFQVEGRGRTILHACAGRGDPGLTQRVLALGVPVDATDFEGTTALHLAIVNRVNMKVLLDAGAAINVRDGSGRTALGRAMRDCKFDAAILLLKEGALVGELEADVPLVQVALEAGRVDVLSSVVEHGADVVRVLLWAAGRVSPGMIATIVRYVDVNAADSSGDTALHVATRTPGCKCNVIELLSLGANACAANAVGDTPLHVAAAMGSSPNVSALIRAGADVTAVNRAGQTAEDFARGRGHGSLSFAESGSGDARVVNEGSGSGTPTARCEVAGRASTANVFGLPAANGRVAATGWGQASRPVADSWFLQSGPSAWPTETGGTAASRTSGWGQGRSIGRRWQG